MKHESPNHVREARATFNLDGADGGDRMAAGLPAAPKKHYRAKVFKSGNSLALRLPAALGLEAGMEMDLAMGPDGTYALRPSPPGQRKFDIDAIWGIARGLGLQPIKPEDRVFDEVKRPWDDPDWPGWGGGDA